MEPLYRKDRPCITPLKDLMEKALKDYDEASRLAHHFNSDIPKAIIKFYTDKEQPVEPQELKQPTEEILYAFRKFFNERYDAKQNEGWRLEILNVDVRDFINKNPVLLKEYAQQEKANIKERIKPYISDEEAVVSKWIREDAEKEISVTDEEIEMFSHNFCDTLTHADEMYIISCMAMKFMRDKLKSNG